MTREEALEQQNKRMSDEEMVKFRQELIDASKEPCETSTDEPMTMVYPTIFYDDAISREEALKPYKDLKDDDVISVWLIRKNIEQQKSVWYSTYRNNV